MVTKISELPYESVPPFSVEIPFNNAGTTEKTLSSDLLGNLPTGAVDAITEIDAGLKSGADVTLITGTAGTNGDLVLWNVDGDAVDGPTPPTGAIIGDSDAQTLTNKTITASGNSLTIAVNDLSDAANTTPSDKDVLVYDGVTDNRYENRALATGDIQSGTFVDARIAQSNVTQHEGALTITELQISDLDHSVDLVSNVATSTILGRVTAGSGNSEELTATQVRTLINVEDGATADQTDAEIKTAYDAEANKTYHALGTEAAAASHSGISVGHIIQVGYRDNNLVNGSGHTASYTGVTTLANAGKWFGASGGQYGYDADGKQFELETLNETVEVYGAVGDSTADDTAAFQAMINARGYFTLAPDREYKITDSLLLTGLASGGQIFSGGGKESSTIIASGMTGKPVITNSETTGSTFYRSIAMRDFEIAGDADNAIKFDEFAFVFMSEFKNLYLTSVADSAFVMESEFSNLIDNVTVASTSGHGFDVFGGVGTVFQNCYPTTIGPTKAGYRIHKKANLFGCNGINQGGYWGLFGADTALGDASTQQFSVQMLGCNVEDWEESAIKLRHTGALVLTGNNWHVIASGTYYTIIDGDDGASGWSFHATLNTLSSGGGTRSASSNIVHANVPQRFIGDSVFPDFFRSSTINLLYTATYQKNDAAGFQDNRAVWSRARIEDFQADTLNHRGSEAGFFGTAPTTQPTALTAKDTATVDATYGAEEQGVIENNRTRIDELETKLKALGLIA